MVRYISVHKLSRAERHRQKQNLRYSRSGFVDTVPLFQYVEGIQWKFLCPCDWEPSFILSEFFTYQFTTECLLSFMNLKSAV